MMGIFQFPRKTFPTFSFFLCSVFFLFIFHVTLELELLLTRRFAVPVTVHFENNFSTNSGLEFPSSYTRASLLGLSLAHWQTTFYYFYFYPFLCFCDKCFLGMSFFLVPTSVCSTYILQSCSRMQFGCFRFLFVRDGFFVYICF